MFDVLNGTEIHFNRVHVGTLRTDISRTMAWDVVSTLETVDPEAVSAKDHQAEIDELERANAEDRKEAEARIAELENENDVLEETLASVDPEVRTTAEEVAELRREIEELRGKLWTAQYDLRVALAPKKRRRRVA